MSDLVCLDDVEIAARSIAPFIVRTPLVAMRPSDVLLKAESLQPSGSFKLRCAFNTLLRLTDDERTRGVVAHSSGNHAIAVAFAAKRLGIPATVVMPFDAPQVKRDWVTSLGATVELVGPASTERTARAAELAAAHGLVLVEPYDAVGIIAATGSITLEVLDDLRVSPSSRGSTELYVPVSGGGLVAGIATAAKAIDQSIRVVGVEPELAADAQASLIEGHRLTWSAEDSTRTIADGLRVQCVGEIPWRHIVEHVDEIVTVSEAEIRASMRALVAESRLVSEPSGAVAAAAAVRRSSGDDGDAVTRVAIVSGGNVEPALLADVLTEHPEPV